MSEVCQISDLKRKLKCSVCVVHQSFERFRSNNQKNRIQKQSHGVL